MSIERELHEDSRQDFKLHNVVMAQQFHTFIFILQHLNRMSRKIISKAVFNYTPNVKRSLIHPMKMQRENFGRTVVLSGQNMEGI